MARHQLSNSASACGPNEPDCQLLHETQAHLRSRQEGRAGSEDDEHTVQCFYDLYNPLLERFVAACHLTRSDAEDCLQEAWKKILESLPGFESDGTQERLCSWMYRIVQNTATNMSRYRRRHPAKSLVPQAEATLASGDAGPVVEAAQHEVQGAVRQVLELLRKELPELTYQAFYERHIEQKSIPEIAAEFRLTEGAVRSRVCDGKREFQRLYERLHSRGGVAGHLIHP